MIRAEYSKDFSTYTLVLSDIEFSDGISLNMKFDTGAVRTVISIWSLFQHLSINTINRLKEGFENAGIKSKEFSSASGNELKGYPCVIHNAKLNGVVIKDFCFYLILDTRRKIALIGDDFVSCCDFHHIIDGDIVIDSFDSDLAYEKFKLDHEPFELNEIIFNHYLQECNPIFDSF